MLFGWDVVEVMLNLPCIKKQCSLNVLNEMEVFVEVRSLCYTLRNGRSDEMLKLHVNQERLMPRIGH